ncbi:hypothetical protein PAXINDRAFT_95901 [Paxillus involutus ATCC 200175]|nr:hypothetical protein PAXINDRAFT_95901 [Paxillus involutus ATCC 200175]
MSSNPSHRQNPPPPRPLSPGVASTASRLLFSMRKSFSYSSTPRRKISETPRTGMYSTPEERHPRNPSRAPRSRYPDTSSHRPTIEQIAMGLHVSRTPHFRPIGTPLQRHSVPSSPSRRNINAVIHASDVPSHPYGPRNASTSALQHAVPHSLPPPPSRSSMKRPSTSTSTLGPPQQPFLSSGAPSTSTVTSGGPATPDSSRPVLSLKSRISKLIPGYRPSSPSSLGRPSSFTSSGSGDTRPTTPRKAVRFSTSVLAVDKQLS